jgi:uncharacterized protein (DUF697 family)/uncharacterized tellurite resistance protein B-like protein
MTLEQQQSILTICLMAAFSDGAKQESERQHLKRVADSFAADDATKAIDLPKLYQDVLMGKANLISACAGLQDNGSKQLAYEMAVHVIDADGMQTSAEKAFLSQLAGQLGLNAWEASQLAQDGDDIAKAAALPAVAIAASAGTAVKSVDTAALDKTILNASILNGALELLPQSWATMAIIPLQTRLVYNIGKAHGYELDSGHIKEFLATVGVGLASQYVEQAGRKLIGGLLSKVVGGSIGSMISGVARGATGMAFSFATTYALGQLAMKYYGGGRTMSSQVLKQTFDQLISPAKNLQAQYLPQIQDKARGVNMSDVMGMLKGSKV